MLKKYIFSLFVFAFLNGLAVETCQDLRYDARSFTNLDATVVTQIGFITEITLFCSGVVPNNYALYAEVDGKFLTAARTAEDRYQISWTEEISKARSGAHKIYVVDEEGWADLRRARRHNPNVEPTPLFAFHLHHPGSYSGPWVNSEVLATVMSILVAYLALRNKSKILA